MYFDVVGVIAEVETIAAGSRVRSLAMLRGRYGDGRWRKLKGIGNVRLSNGAVRRAELHWYEAHGIGRRLMKIKRLLD